MALRVCAWQGCPELGSGRFCARHEPLSARNHRGVPRQARGHGAAHDRAARGFRAERRRCEMALPGCTGWAESSDYSRPGDWASPRRPACLHCQRAQGAAIARGAA